MATNYKKNAAEAKKVVSSLPKEQQAAAQKIIAQATKTGQGLSNNELAYLKANTSKITNTTDPKAFLGTLEQRQTFLTSQQQTPTSTSKTVATTTSYVNANGERIEVTTYTDGSKSERSLGMDSGIAQQRIDWVANLSETFKNYGLPTLAPIIQDLVTQGYSPDTISLKLAETPEYKQRFAGNAARIKQGLPVLSPSEYLATERAYEQIMRSAGLPQGFYDSNDDFNKFIGLDISPTELKSRVDIATLSLNNIDPFYTESLKNIYGLTTGDMVAQVLDPERALPFITKQVQAAQFGAEAARQGLEVTKPVAEQYANLGVTQEQARQGFQAIGQIIPTAEKLSSIYANQTQGYGQEQAMAETFGGPMGAEAALRRKQLTEMEQAAFAGKAGVGQPSLGTSTQGQF